jgi:hypothetical protein
VITNVLFLALLASYIQAILNNMSECPVRALSQSPGLAAFFAANPGEKGTKGVNPEGVASKSNPFRVDWNEFNTQGRPQKTRSTLGFEDQPLRSCQPKC